MCDHSVDSHRLPMMDCRAGRFGGEPSVQRDMRVTPPMTASRTGPLRNLCFVRCAQRASCVMTEFQTNMHPRQLLETAAMEDVCE